MNASISHDLIGRIDQALEMARSVLDAALRPSQPILAKSDEQGLSDPAPGPKDVAPALIRQKVVTEVALFLRAVAPLALKYSRMARASDELCRSLMPHARGDEVIAVLCLDPGNAFCHAAAHIHLSALGYADPQFDAMLNEICSNTAHGGSERMPNHVFEHAWLRAVWSRGSFAALRKHWTSTAISAQQDLLGSNLTDFYVVSHLVLYGSDVGTRDGVWPRPRTAIAKDAEIGLAAALDADNLDLAAEMLWVWPMLRLPWSPAARFGFDLVAAEQDKHGFVPGPGYDPVLGKSLAAPLKHDYVLRTSYHATLVMGIVCAVALFAGGQKLDAGQERHATSGAMDEIVALVPGQDRRWRSNLSLLEACDQSCLADFALSIGLRRAASSNDLRQLRACLGAALRHGLADSLIAAQAAAMLRRAAIAESLADKVRPIYSALSTPSSPSSCSVASSTSTER